MAATLTEIRDGLATVIEHGISENIYTFPFVVDTGRFPAVIIEPASADFERAFQRGTDTWDFTLFILVARGTNIVLAQKTLDELVSGDGPNSIRRAIEDRDDLGIDDSVTASVYALHGYGGAFEWAGTPHVGAMMKVRVVIG